MIGEDDSGLVTVPFPEWEMHSESSVTTMVVAVSPVHPQRAMSTSRGVISARPTTSSAH